MKILKHLYFLYIFLLLFLFLFLYRHNLDTRFLNVFIVCYLIILLPLSNYIDKYIEKINNKISFRNVVLDIRFYIIVVILISFYLLSQSIGIFSMFLLFFIAIFLSLNSYLLFIIGFGCLFLGFIFSIIGNTFIYNFLFLSSFYFLIFGLIFYVFSTNIKKSFPKIDKLNKKIKENSELYFYNSMIIFSIIFIFSFYFDFILTNILSIFTVFLVFFTYLKQSGVNFNKSIFKGNNNRFFEKFIITISLFVIIFVPIFDNFLINIEIKYPIFFITLILFILTYMFVFSKFISNLDETKKIKIKNLFYIFIITAITLMLVYNYSKETNNSIDSNFDSFDFSSLNDGKSNFQIFSDKEKSDIKEFFKDANLEVK